VHALKNTLNFVYLLWHQWNNQNAKMNELKMRGKYVHFYQCRIKKKIYFHFCGIFSKNELPRLSVNPVNFHSNEPFSTFCFVCIGQSRNLNVNKKECCITKNIEYVINKLNFPQNINAGKLVSSPARKMLKLKIFNKFW